MVTRAEIRCVNKLPRYEPHERIKNVGGINPNSSRWKMAQQEAVNGIDNGTHSFYVNRGGRTVEVIVATSRYGNRYLKTEADGEQPDNLLSLPECP